MACRRPSRRSPPGSTQRSSTTSSSGSSTDRRAATVAALIVAVSLAAGWSLSLLASAAGRDWNARLNDSLLRARFAWVGPQKMQRSIVHADLTDSMVEQLGMKGGDRRPFADLVNVLSEAGASAVLFDIVFPSAGTPEGDAAFVGAARRAGTVYLPVVLRTAEAGRALEAAAPAPGGNQPWLWHPKILRAGTPLKAAAVTLSYPALTDAARGIGSINSDPDPDGIFRRMPMLLAFADGYVPSLALRAACDLLRVDPSRIEVSFGQRLRLPGAKLPDGTTRDIDIPIDRAGRTIIDYAGPWAHSYPHYSVAKLLEAVTDPDVADSLSSELDGACVVVSDLTTATGDYGAVPLERVYPRSGIHANLLNSILSNRFLRDQSGAEAVLITLAFAVLLAAAAWRARPLAGSLLGLLAWAGMAGTEFARLAWAGVLPSLAGPTLGFVVALVAINAWRFFQADRERLRTRSRMERYFAPRLLSKILQAPDRLVSAEQKTVTVLFSDVSGFTSWCTTQTPDSIHRTLNEYFELMTEIVFRYEGTVDKFIGDGMMAFFGDPLPQPDHSLRAVRAGIEMQQAVRGLRAQWEPQGRMPIHIRVGINAGEMVVGNMGSSRIMAYTAIGANVNLASRLESKAPVDGILVSAPVYEAVAGSVQTRFAGRITAKGITEDFDTYEVIVP